MSLHQQPPYDTYIHNNSNYSTTSTNSGNNNNISYYNNNNNKGYDHNINTLFVAGLPDNVKAREIHNLFRARPGFDYCQLKYTGRDNQVVAFAIFVNHQSAIAALHAMNGVLFDPQSGHTLKIELARSNSTRIRKPGGGSYVVIDNRNKTEQYKKAPTTDDGNSECDEDNRTHETGGDESDSATAKSAKADADLETTGEAEITEKAANGACSTLFIANLGPNCTKPELEQVVSQYSGFKVLQVRARGATPVAFADFESFKDRSPLNRIKLKLQDFKDAEQASTAMDALQGYSLPSCDRGGMHIEYARSKMRMV